ncbi:hypothetical protein LTR10_012183 [Elasticomyces elasticus]|nr:hypothetical protein LTR10_012183 [Elasticomyces elasticus]KAK4969124.1 hypothetical protein LTR42_009403 [Elasticomyces elasticus]
MAYNAFSVGAEYSWSPVVARVLDGRIGNFLRGPDHPVAHFEPVEPVVRARLGYESGIPSWFFGDQQGLPNLNVAELERATQEYNNDIKHYSCCPHDINTPTPVTCDCFHIRAKYRQRRLPNKHNILEDVYAALEAAVKGLDDQDEWNPDSFIRRPRLPQPVPPLVEWARDPVEAGIIPLELVGPTMNRCSTEGSGCIDTFLLHHTNGPEPRLTAEQRRFYESQKNHESAGEAREEIPSLDSQTTQIKQNVAALGRHRTNVIDASYSREKLDLHANAGLGRKIIDTLPSPGGVARLCQMLLEGQKIQDGLRT